MSDPKAPIQEDETPDGPAPHAPPFFPDICLMMGDLESPAGFQSPAGDYSTNMASAFWEMTLTPYLTMWRIFTGLPEQQPALPPTKPAP